MVDSYEDKLRKRWESKTRGDKANILLKVWPEMPFPHRPDFHAFVNEDCGQKVQGKSKFKDAYMWPQINIEDLTYGRTLLLYVNSRGRHPPQEFVHGDWTACFLGRRSNSITPSPLLKSYTMFLDGRTAIKYGRIVSWDTDAEAQSRLMAGSGFPTVKGLMILEIQQRTMSFLVGCCQTLLSDLTTLFHNPVSKRSFQTAKAKLNVIAAEAPYSAPRGSDFKRLKTIILTRRALAEDNLCAMKVYPGYLGDALAQRRLHRYEMLLDESGAAHPGIDSPSFWNSVIAEVVVHAYGELWAWDYALQQISNIICLGEKYSTEISSRKMLPDEYLKAILIFKQTLGAMERNTSQELRYLFPVSPPYRGMFSRLSLDPACGQWVAHEEVKSDVIMGFLKLLWTSLIYTCSTR